MPYAHRLHAGDEGRTPGRAALLGVIVHELRAFVADAIDVRRLPDHQAAMVDARLHPADVVAHDEEDIGFLRRAAPPPACWPVRTATSASSRQAARRRTACANRLSCAWRSMQAVSFSMRSRHGVALPGCDVLVLLA